MLGNLDHDLADVLLELFLLQVLVGKRRFVGRLDLDFLPVVAAD